MKNWAGFWESDTHELKQIAQEMGVTSDKFQDIYETMYPNIHKWAWYNQTLKDLRELREARPTAYDIAHGLKTPEDLESYDDLQAEIDKLQAELDDLCPRFESRNVRVLTVDTPKWLRNVNDLPPWYMCILPVLCSFNRYLVETHEPWSPPSYVNRLIIAFRTYLAYQGIQYRPYLDSDHAYHRWSPPKECEYEANF